MFRMPAAAGKVRVFANAGVGHLLALRWADVDEDHPMLESWLVQGLVSHRDKEGATAPDDLSQLCCGSK